MSRAGTDPDMTYSYTDPAHKQAVTGVSGGMSASYSYGQRGNMLARTVNNLTYTQTFDVEGRLDSVTVGGQMTTFTYDDAGNRVLAVYNSGTIQATNVYTPFPDYEVEDPPTGDNITRTTYRLAGQMVAVQKRVGAGAGTFAYTYTDHLGNLVALSSLTGVLDATSLARYDPFGNYRTTPATNPGMTDQGFTGHRHNNTGTNNLGLIYMNARYYLTEVGRFVSADTIVPEPENPQSYNRYAYVRNSPLNFTDPTGHREADCSGKVCSALPAPARATPLVIFDAAEGEAWTVAEIRAVRSGAFVNAGSLAGAINALNWREYRQSIHRGEAGSYERISARDAFLLVYGGSVTFYKTGTACAEGCLGRYVGDNTINVYTGIYHDGASIIPSAHTGGYWAVHELGHVFEARINTAVRDNEHARNQLALATNIDRRGMNPALEPNSGFAGSFPGWQQSTVASTGEELADMYIGWTYGQWDDTTQGRARSTFMLQHMSGWISLFR